MHKNQNRLHVTESEKVSNYVREQIVQRNFAQNTDTTEVDKPRILDTFQETKIIDLASHEDDDTELFSSDTEQNPNKIYVAEANIFEDTESDEEWEDPSHTSKSIREKQKPRLKETEARTFESENDTSTPSPSVDTNMPKQNTNRREQSSTFETTESENEWAEIARKVTLKPTTKMTQVYSDKQARTKVNTGKKVNFNTPNTAITTKRSNTPVEGLQSRGLFEDFSW